MTFHTKPHLYVLNADHSVTGIYNLMEWAERFQFDDENRFVAHDHVGPDKILVSTVFVGIDHNFHDSGPPIVFETMVFGGAYDQHQERYATWDEAAAGHKRWVEAVTLMLEGFDA